MTDILTEAVRNITDKNDGIASTASINDSLIKNQVLPAFTQFIDKCSETNATWRFWSQFVFKDGLAYITLFAAMRSGNWDLRVASLKMIAPIFSAFDHFTCKKIIAQHLADILTFPSSIMNI